MARRNQLTIIFKGERNEGVRDIDYMLIVLVVAIYSNWWGELAYKGFAYNLGRAIIWPVFIIPGLGEVIGGIVMLVVGIWLFRSK